MGTKREMTKVTNTAAGAAAGAAARAAAEQPAPQGLKGICAIGKLKQLRLNELDADLNREEWQTMVALRAAMMDNGGEDVRFSQIAAHMNVSDQTISRGLRSLEKKGYVQRKADIRDRRATFVELTMKGIEKAGELEEQAESLFQAVQDRLGRERVERLMEDLNAFVELSGEELERMKEGRG